MGGNAGDALDWRTIFLIGGALPLLLVPVVLWLLPETRPDHDPDADRGLARGLFSERRALTTFLIWVVFGLDLLVTYLLLNWLPTLVVARRSTPTWRSRTQRSPASTRSIASAAGSRWRWPTGPRRRYGSTPSA